MSTDAGSPATEFPPERRAALNAARLRALVADRWSSADHPEVARLGTGAALVADRVAHVLLEGNHGLGAAMAWALRSEAESLRVLVDATSTAGHLARRAGHLSFPVEVFTIDGRSLAVADPAPVEETEGPPDSPELVGLLHQHALEAVVEGDRIAAEVNGLEIARIVRALDNGEPILEVGVGRFDRELTAMMHGDLTPSESLARVADKVREIRRPDPPNHPLATLVPERWLRARLIADPSRIGCDELVAAPAPKVRDRLRERGTAIATGTRDGAPVVVACAVGVDLEAPIEAADARAALDPDAHLVVAMPARDVLPVVERMVSLVRRPAEIVPVEGDWRR